MPEVKVTPALREWCRRLSRPESCTLVSSGRFFVSTRGFSSIAPPNRPTVRKLEDAGLITWSSPSAQEERTAVLTEAGRVAAGVSVPSRQEGSS